MFNLLRYFSLTSLVAIMVVTFFLGIFYNHLAEKNLSKLTEDQNVFLTHYMLSEIDAKYKNLLVGISDPMMDPSNLRAAIAQFNSVINSAMKGLKIGKIKVYSPGGANRFFHRPQPDWGGKRSGP